MKSKGVLSIKKVNPREKGLQTILVLIIGRKEKKKARGKQEKQQV